MGHVVTGYDSFGVEVLRAFGIDHENVNSATIRISADSLVTIDVVRYLTHEDGEKFLELTQKQYTFEPKKIK